MSETEKRLYGIISKLSGKEIKDLSNDMYLIDDLGFESVQLMNLIVEIENNFNVEFDDSDMLFDNFNHISDLCNLVNQLLKKKAATNI